MVLGTTETCHSQITVLVYDVKNNQHDQSKEQEHNNYYYQSNYI